MTPADIAALHGLCERATPGPWRASGYEVFTVSDGGQGYPLDRYTDSKDVITEQCEECGNRKNVGIGHEPDAAFIAAARSALPALIDEAERLTKILDDRMCMKCGGQGEWCVDRCYGNEHYQEMEQCAECNGDGRTEEGAQKKIAALTAERDRLRSALATATAECDALRGEVDRLRGAHLHALARIAIDSLTDSESALLHDAMRKEGK